MRSLPRRSHDFLMPDLAKVAEHSDPKELGRLQQLILGCAVRCERKQGYVQIIMTLEESVQHVVMTAIQEVSKALKWKCVCVPNTGSWTHCF